MYNAILAVATGTKDTAYKAQVGMAVADYIEILFPAAITGWGANLFEDENWNMQFQTVYLGRIDARAGDAAALAAVRILNDNRATWLDFPTMDSLGASGGGGITPTILSHSFSVSIRMDRVDNRATNAGLSSDFIAHTLLNAHELRPVGNNSRQYVLPIGDLSRFSQSGDWIVTASTNSTHFAVGHTFTLNTSGGNLVLDRLTPAPGSSSPADSTRPINFSVTLAPNGSSGGLRWNGASIAQIEVRVGTSRVSTEPNVVTIQPRGQFALSHFTNIGDRVTQSNLERTDN
jgi:hypothetical protein